MRRAAPGRHFRERFFHARVGRIGAWKTKQPGGNKTGIIVAGVLLLLVTLCCCGGVFCSGGTTVWQHDNGKGAPPVEAEKTDP